MGPTENAEQQENDFRYRMVVDLLTDNQISIDEANYLHRWLSDEVSSYSIQKTITTVLESQKDSEQRLCARLKKSASAIKKQFDFLQQFSEIDRVMSIAFKTIKPADAETTQEQWREFRDQIYANADTLEKIIKQATQIQAAGNKRKGRPPNDWKSALIMDLCNYFVNVSGHSQNKCSLITHGVFDIYFPDEAAGEAESTLKTITRSKHKTVRTELSNFVPKRP